MANKSPQQLRRLPPWIRTKFPAVSTAVSLRHRTYAQGLATVCKEARCPNQGECSGQGTATFLILGDRCTRDCSFCAVRHGKPLPVSMDEPKLVAAAVSSMGLGHAVVTSVTRDDLHDGGAGAFAATIRAIREVSRFTTVEVLIPDFQGDWHSLKKVIDAGPDVINHNIETVPRLYPVVRSGASYERSVELLERVHVDGKGIVTKSGLMVGLGETRDEVLAVIRDLVRVRVVLLTIGQYLRPTQRHHPVDRYLPPHEFDELKNLALAEGVLQVAAGPLVRSSYRAAWMFEHLERPAKPEDGHP